MALFRPGTRRKPRKFKYEPRFYNPDDDEKLKRRMRMRRKKNRRRSPASIIYFILLLGFAIFVYLSI